MFIWVLTSEFLVLVRVFFFLYNIFPGLIFFVCVCVYDDNAAFVRLDCNLNVIKDQVYAWLLLCLQIGIVC